MKESLGNNLHHHCSQDREARAPNPDLRRFGFALRSRGKIRICEIVQSNATGKICHIRTTYAVVADIRRQVAQKNGQINNIPALGRVHAVAVNDSIVRRGNVHDFQFVVVGQGSDTGNVIHDRIIYYDTAIIPSCLILNPLVSEVHVERPLRVPH